MSSLTAAYATGAGGAAVSYFLRLEQEATKDASATIGDAAELLDELYDRDPCVESEEEETEQQEGEETAEPPMSKEEFWQKVQDLLDLTTCEDDSADIVGLQVFRSHKELPYTLVLENGNQGETTLVTQLKKETIAVAAASSFLFKFPVDPGSLKYSWSSARAGDGTTITGPAVEASGTTGKIERAVTGIIRVEYTTSFDRVAVTIPRGSDGQPGSCHVRGLYHGLVEEIDIVAPPVDEQIDEPAKELICDGGEGEYNWEDKPYSCYERIYHQVLCRCSGKDSGDSYTSEQDCNCPSFWGDDISPGRHLVGSRTVLEKYIGCPGESPYDSAAEAKEEYKETCCVDGVPPECDKIYRTYKGGKSVDKDDIKASYGDNVTLIPVGPDGGVCGTWLTEYVKQQRNCCDDVSQLEWDYDLSFEVISNNDHDEVFIKGGTGTRPLTWKVRGNGFYVDPKFTKRDLVTYDNSLDIYTTDDACGPCTIFVTDGCSSVSVVVRCTVGVWVARPELDGLAVISGAGEGVPGQTCNGWLTRTEGRYRMFETVTAWCIFDRPPGGDCVALGLDECFSRCGSNPSDITGNTPWQFALTGRPDGFCSGLYYNNDRLVQYWNTLYSCRCQGAGVRETEEFVCP